MADDNQWKIIREVAKEEGISPTVLEKAWRNQWKVLRDTIVGSKKNQPETFKVVYIKYIGKFIPKLAMIRKMKEYADRKSKTDS